VEPAADYDRFVDWSRRLEREAPFFRREFAGHDVRRVVDVGTGSGMLPTLWARWGLDVIGVDPNASMLAQAERNAAAAAGEIAAAGGSLRFLPGAFGGLGSLGLGTLDAVTATGNGLPHIAGIGALVPTLRDFASVLRPGGLLVLHLLNHDRLLAERIRAIPPVVRDVEDGRWVFLRIMDYVEGGILFDFVTLHRPDMGAETLWETASRRSLHTALPSATLMEGLGEAGFRNVAFFGGHDGTAFRPDIDESVVVTAVKGWRGRR
jgi:glycine/sarcosine N-methyltransferase